MMRQFRDRVDAGQALGRALRQYQGNKDVLVLGLPRGGVPVAYEVAKALRAPLDICLVRKLGVPGHEELAMGAIASDGVRVMNPQVVLPLHITQEVIDEVAAEELHELRRREIAYRGGRAAMSVAGRVVLLVDDGLATGASMRAAVRVMQHQGAASVIVAVPVAPLDTCDVLAREADDVICLLRPEEFEAIGQYYESFEQLTDDEVRSYLELSTTDAPPAGQAKSPGGRFIRS